MRSEMYNFPVKLRVNSSTVNAGVKNNKLSMICVSHIMFIVKFQNKTYNLKFMLTRCYST